MTHSAIMKRLEALDAAAKAARAADVYLPRSEWPLLLRLQDIEWKERCAGWDYAEYLTHIHEAPEPPLKPEYKHLTESLEGLAELYNLVKGRKPICCSE